MDRTKRYLESKIGNFWLVQLDCDVNSIANIERYPGWMSGRRERMNSLLLVVSGIIEVTLRHPSGDVRLDIYIYISNEPSKEPRVKILF